MNIGLRVFWLKEALLFLQLLSWSFDPNYMVRGLVLDKKRGNILKVKIKQMFYIPSVLPGKVIYEEIAWIIF
jgi:hypothetical protein